MATDLAQQASGFRSNRGRFYSLEKSNVPVCQIGYSSFWPMEGAKICSAEPGSAKPDSQKISAI
jgi:hypothetical protein